MEEIKKTWRIIAIDKNSLLELRPICPMPNINKIKPFVKHFRGSDYSYDVEKLKNAFESEALKLNALGFNIYTTLNPIKHDAEFCHGKACSIKDIDYRDLLFIDIDRANDTSQPASEEELLLAEGVCDALIAYFKSEGEAPVAKVMSGNGYHLYYELEDIPNSEEATQAIKQLLYKLASDFNNDKIKIDTSVSDPSRITKVLGCIARKGTASEQRPYRMVTLC